MPLRSRSQSVTLKHGQNLKYLPHAFTEQGVATLPGVLRSEQAVQVNVAIMRAFVGLRRMLADNHALAKLAEMDRKLEGHDQVGSARTTTTFQTALRPIP